MAEANISFAREEDYQEIYPVTAFAEYLETKLCWSPSGRKHHHFRWLFWSPEQDELEEAPQTISFSSYPVPTPATPSNHGTIIKQKIKFALQQIIECYIDYCLVQFWAPETRCGRRYLTTLDQPFAVDWLCKGFCWYREQCMSHHYSADAEANEAELGPPGRVFRAGLPESSPDLRLYSTKEYPLRNHSLSCGIKAYMALPVFEMLGQQCIGVLEFVVFSAGYINIINEVEEGLKAADLRWNVNINQPSSAASHLTTENNHRGQQKALNEVEEMLKVLKRTPQLYLAQAWITSKQCAKINDINSGTIFMERAKLKVFVDDEEHYNSSTTHFLKASKLHGLILGNGIAGRLLATYTSFYCPSICNFNITEYPLLHYARLARLTASFAICLQSTLTEDDIYVLEFFLLPGSSDAGYSWSLLPFLMTVMEQQLQSFKLLSGQLLGEGLSVKAVQFCNSAGFDDCSELGQSTPYPLRLETLYYKEDLEKLHTAFGRLHFGCEVIESSTMATGVEQNVNVKMAAEKSNKAITTASKREREKQKFRICYEDLQTYFGKTLRDAEKGLGVSRSTLKRACRDHNITRWPSNEKNKANTLLFRNKGSESDFVIVEADFEGDTIKFKLPISSGMAKLEDELVRRLKLNVTSFRVKYMDEDGKWILLTCDDDLEFCMETLASSSNNNPVKMLVQLL